MQTAPFTSSQKRTEHSGHHETSTSTQHGLQYGDAAARQPPDIVSGAGPADEAEQIAADAVFAAALQEDDPRGEKTRGLSKRETPSPPARIGHNIITEYEKASTPPNRKEKTGLEFEVLKKYRSPTDTRSPIQELPNGM
jgi:hypothetical protein